MLSSALQSPCGKALTIDHVSAGIPAAIVSLPCIKTAFCSIYCGYTIKIMLDKFGRILYNLTVIEAVAALDD